LKPDDCVYVRNFSSNSNQKWLPGIILKRRGPVSYVTLLITTEGEEGEEIKEATKKVLL